MNERVGFVGVGRMGANMARRVKDVGYTVAAVYDVSIRTVLPLLTVAEQDPGAA